MTEFAEQFGVSVSEMSRWESGAREPKLERFRDLCLALGVSSDEILGIE
jgi:transcriptional regulator with XRE-family HTH domain